VITGLVIGDLAETADFRAVGRVAIALLAGAAILWLAEQVGTRTRRIGDLGAAGALGIGAAQALALVPGISRSGIAISAGLFAGLDREAAARFSFLMATPITAGAGLFELRKMVSGEAGGDLAIGPLLAGTLASLAAGLVAIALLLRFLRTNPTTVFIIYRIILAAVVAVAWLGLWDR
jgi:undecaprenyl-diphosphatase